MKILIPVLCLLLTTSCGAGTITVDSKIAERQAAALEQIVQRLDRLIVAVDSNTASGEMIVIPQVSYRLENNKRLYRGEFNSIGGATVSETERRKGMDELFEQIKELTRITSEISQRQKEFTLPRLENLEKCLHGNGKPGLLIEHGQCQNRIDSIERTIQRAQNWIIGLLTTGITGFFGYLALHVFIKK
jgi:hypothetical protein